MGIKYFNKLGSGTIVDDLSIYLSSLIFLAILWFLMAFGGLIFNKKNGKWVFLGIIFAIAVHFIISDGIIKQTVFDIFPARQRPYAVDPTIRQLGTPYQDSSFPSGHLTTVVGVFMVFGYYFRRWWIFALCTIFVLITGFTRLHNGVHYPSDVVGGIILGFGYGMLAIYLTSFIRKRYFKT